MDASEIIIKDNGQGDYSTIQNAIDNANAGDTIYIWPGTYYERLIINKTVTIIGNGTGKTIIDGGVTGNVITISSNWVNFFGCTITNSGINEDNANIKLLNVNNCLISEVNCSNDKTGIYIENSNSIRIENSSLNSNEFAGIWIYSSDNTIIQNTRCSWNSLFGIYVSRSNNVEIIDNNLVSNKQYGILLENCLNSKLRFNSMLYNGLFISGNKASHWINQDIDTTNSVNSKILYYYKNKDGVTVPNNAGQVILANCDNMNIKNLNLIRTGFGILLGFSDNNFIEDNSCNFNTNGIYLFYSNNNMIQNNFCENNSKNGIDLINSYYNKIKNNVLTNNMNGINIYKCNNITIYSNTCNGNSVNGLSVDSSINISIDETYCNNNHYNGMNIISSNLLTITNNICNSNLNDGLFLSRSIQENKLSANKCKFNLVQGIHLENSNNNNLNNNEAIYNNHDGVYLKQSTNNILSENLVNSNYHGIYSDSSDDNVYIKNTLNSNKYYGLYFTFSYDNILMNNEASYNYIGIQLESALNNNLSNNIFNSNKMDGINLATSSNNTIKNNTISTNGLNGIALKLTADYDPIYGFNTKPGSGKIYYVSTKGSDTNLGTSEQSAWRTMEYADEKLKPGDTLYVKAGDYGHDTPRLPDGSPGKPIKLIGYYNVPGDIISNGYPNWVDTKYMPVIGTGYDAGILLASYCEVYNFYINSSTFGLQINYGKHHSKIVNCFTYGGSYGIVLNSINTQRTIFNCEVINCSVVNASARGYCIMNVSNCTFKNNYAESHFATDYIFLMEKCRDCLVDGYDIKWIKTDKYGQSGYNHGGRGLAIKDMYEFTRTRWHSIRNTIKNCKRLDTNWDHGGTVNFYGLNQYCIVENLTDLAIRVYNGVENYIIRNCIVRNYQVGLNVYWGYETPTLVTKNITFENIIIENCNEAIAVGRGSRDVVIKNCIIYNSLKLFRFQASPYTTMKVDMKNCIIKNVTTYYIISDATVELSTTYSCFHNCDFSKPSGIGNIEADPLFANPDKFDFHLRSEYGRWNGISWVEDPKTSPCIDSGEQNDPYRREPQPNGGRINMGVFGNQNHASKSPMIGKYGYFETSDNNLITENTITSNAILGLYLSNSSGNKIFNNILDENFYGIYFNESHDNDISSNTIQSSKENSIGILMENSDSNNFVSSNIMNIGHNSYGYYLHNFNSTIINSTISTPYDRDGIDIIITHNGTITSVNNTFKTINLTRDWGGTLKIYNYLDIQIYDNDEITPFINVDVQIQNEESLIYSTPGYNGVNPTTNNRGRISNILMPDRWFIHSETAVRNSTTIKVKKLIDNKLWEDIRPNVDMKISHTEFFYAPDEVPPDTPSGLRITRVNNSNTLNISWDIVKNTKNYTVYKVVSDNWAILNNNTHPQNWTFDENLMDEKYHFYKVQAWNGLGMPSNFSEIVSIYLRDITPPTTPKGLTVRSESLNDKINLTWDLNEDDTRYYDIWYKDIIFDEWKNLGNVTHPINYYLWGNGNLVNNNHYIFKIRAIDKVLLYSPFTDPVNITHFDKKPPLPPKNLMAKSLPDNKIELTWDSLNHDVVRYKVFINQTNFGSGGPYLIIGLTLENYFLITNLLENTTYYFVVVSIDEANNTSPFSNEAWNISSSFEDLPIIQSTIPILNENNVPVDIKVTFRFSMPVDPDTVINAIIISPEETFNVSYKDSNKLLEIIFDHNLSYNTTYEVKIKNIKDIFGRRFQNTPFILNFRTVNRPELLYSIIIIQPKNGSKINLGSTITIFGYVTGFNEGTIITVTLLSENTKTTSININGYWIIKFDAPNSTGEYRIIVTIENISTSIVIFIEDKTEVQVFLMEPEDYLLFGVIFIIIILIGIILFVYRTKFSNVVEFTDDSEVDEEEQEQLEQLEQGDLYGGEDTQETPMVELSDEYIMYQPEAVQDYHVISDNDQFPTPDQTSLIAQQQLNEVSIDEDIIDIEALQEANIIDQRELLPEEIMGLQDIGSASRENVYQDIETVDIEIEGSTHKDTHANMQGHDQVQASAEIKNKNDQNDKFFSPSENELDSKESEN